MIAVFPVSTGCRSLQCTARCRMLPSTGAACGSLPGSARRAARASVSIHQLLNTRWTPTSTPSTQPAAIGHCGQAKPQRRRQIATTPAVGPPGARTGGPASPDFLPRSETELTVVSLQHASRSCYCIEICQCPDHRVELPSRHSSPVGDGGHVRGAAAVLSRLVLSAAKPNTISVREPNSGLIRLGG